MICLVFISDRYAYDFSFLGAAPTPIMSKLEREKRQGLLATYILGINEIYLGMVHPPQ